MKLIKGEEIPISGVIDRVGVAIESSLQGGVGLKEGVPMELAYWLTFVLALYFVILIIIKCVKMFIRKFGGEEVERDDKFTKIFWGVVKTVVFIIIPVLITASVYVLSSI